MHLNEINQIHFGKLLLKNNLDIVKTLRDGYVNEEESDRFTFRVHFQSTVFFYIELARFIGLSYEEIPRTNVTDKHIVYIYKP